jgi:hypothetical protein
MKPEINAEMAMEYLKSMIKIKRNLADYFHNEDYKRGVQDAYQLILNDIEGLEIVVTQEKQKIPSSGEQI